MKIEIRVPCFSGFYGGIWSQIENESYEIECMAENYDGFSALCFLHDWGFQKDYRDNVAKLFANNYESLIHEHITPNMHLINAYVVSPREYNFATDAIYAMFEVDDYDELIDTLRSIASRPEYRTRIAKLIKENHTSYSGFQSWMSNDFEDWMGLIEDPENSHYVYCLIMYILSLIDPNIDNFNEMMYDYVVYNTGWHNIEPLTTEAKEEWDLYLKYNDFYIDWITKHPRTYQSTVYVGRIEQIDWNTYKSRFLEEAEKYEKEQEYLKLLSNQPAITGLFD